MRKKSRISVDDASIDTNGVPFTKNSMTKDSNFASNIGFIGAGQMATALASGFVQSGVLSADCIHAFDPGTIAMENFQHEIPGSVQATDNAQLLKNCGTIFLAVKPQIMHVVYDELKGKFQKGHLIVSIAAGILVKDLAAGLGTQNIIRVMPNTPCLVGKGAIGFSPHSSVAISQIDRVKTLLDTVGLSYQVTEELLNVVTGLSGSGPAYVFEIIEALSDGAVRMGLPREMATRLAAQTLFGAAAMVLETGTHPGELKDRVSSPGGTTIAGLYALEKGALRGTLMSAVEAATRRSIELGK